MKRTILLTVLTLLIASSTAIAGYDGSKNQPHIMGSGSSASGSAAAGPNGTEWRSTVEMRERSPNINITDKVQNTSYSGNKARFSGFIQAPTPCHIIDQETEKVEENSYRINVQTIKENQSQICIQQVVMIEYEASFEAEAPYTLEIRHNNQTVDTLENTVTEEETQRKSGEGFMQGFITWLSSLL